MQLFNYNAGAGDCIRLRFDNHNVIIDSGVLRFGQKFRTICDEIRLSDEGIDALILTHVDVDHIGGLLYNLRLSKDLPIREVWMNHGKSIKGNVDLSVRQNDEVYSWLVKNHIPVFPVIAGMERNVGGATFRILAPDDSIFSEFHQKCHTTLLRTQSDYGYSIDELKDKPIRNKDISLNNRASVVFELIYDGTKMLFTGDAWGEDIWERADSSYDLIKLPHHGSVRNISEDWCRIKCRNFMICTNGLQHPDKQTIAKLIKWNEKAKFYGSNGWWKKMLTEDDEKYKDYFEEGEEVSWQLTRTN